jgi:hypothetical protein
MGTDARRFLYRKAAELAMKEATAVIAEKMKAFVREWGSLARTSSQEEAEAAWKAGVDKILDSMGPEWVLKRAREIGDEWDLDAEMLQEVIADLKAEIEDLEKRHSH